MTALRIVGDIDAWRRAPRAPRPVVKSRSRGKSGGTVPFAAAVSGQRVRVTRSDIGTANGRVRATAAERAPHGAVNTRSEVTDRNPDGSRYRPGALHDSMTYVTTERRDSFDTERDSNAGEVTRHTTKSLDTSHRANLLRSTDWKL